MIISFSQIVVLTCWRSGSGPANILQVIVAREVSDKDILPPIIGLNSVPSFSRESTLSKEFSAMSITPEETGDVTFF